MKTEFIVPALSVVGVIAALALLLCGILGAVRRRPRVGSSLLETVSLSVLGGLLACGFLGFLLEILGNSRWDALLLGWSFLFWFGVVDTVAVFTDAQWLTQPLVLLCGAAAVGAFVGACDGAASIHNWKGWGWLGFPLDVSWGLAGTTNGLLFHLINIAWGGHAGDPRTGAHRYHSGFRFASGFAVTQGSVMSNMNGSGPSTGLFRHENTHVWQNRIFGPFFFLTYMGWMVLMFLPALVAGLISRRASVGEAIMDLCYYNNPWEVWAYRRGAGPRVGRGPMVWPDTVAIAACVPFFLVVLVLGGWLLNVA